MCHLPLSKKLERFKTTNLSSWATRILTIMSKSISRKWQTLKFTRSSKRTTAILKTLRNLWQRSEILKLTRSLLNICLMSNLRILAIIHLNPINKNMDNLMSLKSKLSKTKWAKRDEIAIWQPRLKRSKISRNGKFCCLLDRWKLKIANSKVQCNNSPIWHRKTSFS